MDKLTLEDSFRELIKQRKWYVNSLRSPIQAKYDKATFQKGGQSSRRTNPGLFSCRWLEMCSA